MSPDRTPESHPIRSNVPRSGKPRALDLLSSVGRHWVEARAFPDWGIPGTGKHRARTKTFHHPQQRLCAIHRRAELLKSFLHQFQDSSWTLLCGLRARWREFRTPHPSDSRMHFRRRKSLGFTGRAHCRFSSGGWRWGSPPIVKDQRAIPRSRDHGIFGPAFQRPESEASSEPRVSMSAQGAPAPATTPHIPYRQNFPNPPVD